MNVNKVPGTSVVNDSCCVSLQGIFISKVNAGGAADKAGLAVADKLLSVSEAEFITTWCIAGNESPKLHWPHLRCDVGLEEGEY